MALPSDPSPVPAYDRVVLIYNPESSGDGARRAEQARSQLHEQAPQLEVVATPTEYAGHARVLAEQEARAGRVLVVSVSGDGGYHEVVEGLMAAGDGVVAGAVGAVLPAGNANDHRRATRERPLVDAIAAGQVRRLDLLRVAVAGEERPRWAHSYFGLGITPTVALEIERGGKGSLREIVTTVRAFSRFRPFAVDVEGEGPLSGPRRFDSLILANTTEMAKYVTLSDGDPADGRFEVITLPHRSKLRLLAYAVRAAVRGLGPQPRTDRFAFTTLKPMPVQLDGEVLDLDADRAVTVEIAPRALATVV
ncbi:diacylglycerol/lipid kinase family protein [Actinomycetospora cinnamomea]|uniref:Diacylglycerol kinase family enzyme n=1 Tax=Actinomycetospora cinnamomea TaxID=663609 RepID=A0A2U1E9D3_9PSEU|nr:diacylglycerol kinase family protein [Actinomycetospora cinnamomea]PVY96329.1 diacylglycerol kinase family enzyme [Actinomycetospora cinnamomea]